MYRPSKGGYLSDLSKSLCVSASSYSRRLEKNWYPFFHDNNSHVSFFCRVLNDVNDDPGSSFEEVAESWKSTTSEKKKHLWLMVD